jgi:hypothetical protein
MGSDHMHNTFNFDFENDAPASFTHFRNSSWLDELWTPMAPIMLAFGILGVVLFTSALSLSQLHIFDLNMPTVLVAVIVFLPLTFIVISLANSLLNRHKIVLSETEERIAFKKTSDLWQDVNSLISGNLRLRKFGVADFYSKHLLALSEQYSNLPNRLPIWLISTDCWLSSPDYENSWRYKLGFSFRTRGTLFLTKDMLHFESGKIAFNARIDDIKSLNISWHSRWLKPILQRYIVVSFDDDGLERIFYLTPSYLRTDTVWDTNKLVNKWYMYLYNLDGAHRRANPRHRSVRPAPLAVSGTFRAVSV